MKSSIRNATVLTCETLPVGDKRKTPEVIFSIIMLRCAFKSSSFVMAAFSLTSLEMLSAAQDTMPRVWVWANDFLHVTVMEPSKLSLAS